MKTLLCTIYARLGVIAGLILIVLLASPRPANGEEPTLQGDVLVLANGDILHGKLINEVAGKVTFHTDALGDVSLSWDKVKELHVSQPFAVLDKNVKLRGKEHASRIPVGSLDMTDQAVTVHAQPAPGPIPVKNAQYIVDQKDLDKEINHEPNFFTGWNGAATAGATLVKATQSQYTVSGSLALARIVPTVTWINPRNRTTADFSGSYGKITQPGYTSGGIFTPSQTTKSSIYHVDAERDQYVAPRFFALAQLAYDHNYSQDLQLQQIYGAGMGFTLFSTPRHEADLKATLQYEKQQFISGAPGTNQNLIGSTFAANYMLKTKSITYAQSLQFIPAYNTPRAYSATETNTVTFPAYKSFAFTLGTLDSYLNDPPISVPPTQRNSFQFTMGLTYAIKSKY